MENTNSQQEAIIPFRTITDISYTDTYEMQKQIGVGVSGAVYLAKNKHTSEIRAIKKIQKTHLKVPVDSVRNEIEILTRLDHPNIVKMYETYEDEECFCLIMEVCEGMELFDAIVTMEFISERKASKIFKQIVAAVNYLHSNNIVHRDLKPENIMLYDEDDATVVKLIDFGIAKQCFSREQKLSTRSGSPYYIAPEILSGIYDHRVDIWALGIILHSMLVGYPPFQGESDQEIYLEIKCGELDFSGEEWDGISRDAIELVTQLLTRDPEERITMLETTSHHWLNSPDSPTPRRPLNLDALRNYSQRLHFQKTVLLTIARQLNESETRILRDQFQAIDLDQDGYLDNNEFFRGMEQSGMRRAEIEQAWNCLTSNGAKEKIGYSEFITASINPDCLLSQQNLTNTFKILDRDADGLITPEDLDIVLTEESRKLWEVIFISACGPGYTGVCGIDFTKFCELVTAASMLT